MTRKKPRYRLSLRDPNVSLTNLRYSTPCSIVRFPSGLALETLLHNKWHAYWRFSEKETLRKDERERKRDERDSLIVLRRRRWLIGIGHDDASELQFKHPQSFLSRLLQLVALFRCKDDSGPLGLLGKLWANTLFGVFCTALFLFGRFLGSEKLNTC